MNCRRFDGLTFEYLDGTLGADRRRQMDRHLEVCAGCRGVAAAQREFAAGLRRELREDTRGLALFSTVRETILRDASRRRVGRRRWEVAGSLLVAACVVLACLGPLRPASAPELVAPTVWPEDNAALPVTIQASTTVTQYTFERHGDRVTDCLTQGTRTDEASFNGS